MGASLDMNDRLKSIRLALKLSQYEFGSRIEVVQSHLSQIERGNRDVTSKIFHLVCLRFGVSEHWFRTGEGAMFVENDSDFIERIAREHGLDDFGKNYIREYIQLSKEDRAIIKKYVSRIYSGESIESLMKHPSLLCVADTPSIRKASVRVYRDPTSAGRRSYLADNGCEDVDFPEESVPPGALFGVRATGDSMEPGISDGDVAFVEPADLLEEGEVGVFAYDGRSYIRRLAVDCAAREIRLEADNPAREPIVVRDESLLRTIGRVLGRARI